MVRSGSVEAGAALVQHLDARGRTIERLGEAQAQRGRRGRNGSTGRRLGLLQVSVSVDGCGATSSNSTTRRASDDKASHADSVDRSAVQDGSVDVPTAVSLWRRVADGVHAIPTFSLLEVAGCGQCRRCRPIATHAPACHAVPT